jgi:hypothetical protein
MRLRNAKTSKQSLEARRYEEDYSSQRGRVKATNDSFACVWPPGRTFMDLRTESRTESRTIRLTGHQLIHLRAPLQLRAEHGLLWITVDGEGEDHLLAPGDCRRFGRKAGVVVYALGGDARFAVTPDALAHPSLMQRLADGWMAWLRGHRHVLGTGT